MILKVTPDADEYPAGLLDLEDPPSLYTEGQFRSGPSVAVVGTRRCTSYGVRLAEAYGGAISRAGWSVVSGLARGIDTAAHRGCLASNGHAVAILGCGIEICYPYENKPIRDEIVASGGQIVSEYPGTTPPDRWRFPARNRLIASWADAVVVVEAGVTGGALITARIAAEIGRPVLAVPGDVDRAASVGCNLLIRDGAIPVLDANDLVQSLSLIVGPPMEPRTSLCPIPPDGSAIEDLADLWGLPIGEVLTRVGTMELEGTVVRSGDRVIPRT